MFEKGIGLKGGKRAIFILTIVILVLITAVVILSVKLAQIHRQAVLTAAELSLEEEPEETVYEAPDLEPLFNTDDSAKVFLYDYTFGEIWLPLLKDVPLNTYSDENYKTVDGFKYYYEDNEEISFVGIDVSIHQKKIDWEKVKNDGVDFVMIRLGYRGYQTGEIGLDSNYIKNISGALEAGLDVGVYFFSQAINVEEVIEEAEFVVDALKDYEITYPVAFDWEVITDDEARTDSITVNELTNMAIAFCETIESHGYTPMVYSNRKQAYLKFDLTRLTEYDFWLAEFNEVTPYKYHYNMWQYTDSGIVDGIDGNVDLNISFVDYGGIYRQKNGIS